MVIYTVNKSLGGKIIMEPPSTIHNRAKWQSNCGKIRARAMDFLENRLGLIEAARELSKLAVWTQLLDDPDLKTFIDIDSMTASLPNGSVRDYWHPYALKTFDVAIEQAEKGYHDG
jgi:hypothetical protein